jgi:hypothetical protein
MTEVCELHLHQATFDGGNMSVRNRVLPEGNQRVFGATVIASVMLFGVACHSGVESPTSPSATTGSVPTTTTAALATGEDTATTRGAPISFVMSEVAGLGFSGTCTLGPGGAGFRIKASGQGVPGQRIRFVLVIKPTVEDPEPGWYVDIAQVDDKGNFRTGGERVTYIASGREVYCAVIEYPGAGILAQGPDFTIP